MLVQIFWLWFIVSVPIGIMLTRQSQLLLAWVCLVTCVDIFKFFNVGAATVTGLLLIPCAVKILSHMIRTRPSQLLVAQYAYLVLLGLVFGFLFPWPDELGRPFSLQAPGRTILYFTRQVANLSLALFVAQQVVKLKHPNKVFHYILVGTLLAMAAGLAERLTGVSLYVLLTEGILSPTFENLRVRGFNFEPRGLGLTAAHGILLCMLLSLRRRSWAILALLAANVCVLILTVSASAALATAAGIGVLVLFHKPARRILSKGMIVAACVALVPIIFQPDWFRSWEFLLMERIGSTIRYGSAANWFEEVVFRLEIFDTSALLFFVDNPVYILFGTGPGLIPLPATPYLPVTAYTEGYVVTGINSPPTMGSLLELSNAGLIGITLWSAFFMISLRALDYLIKYGASTREEWEVGKGAFLGAAAMYLVAAGFLSSFWPLFMGIGLAAGYLRHIHRLQQKDVREV